MKRSAAIVHQQMGQGLNSLATIASIAPLIGVYGTVIGVIDSFPGFSGSRGALMGMIFERLSYACVPTALGLLVAVPSLCCYKYLTGRLKHIDCEMENVSLELMNLLALCPVRVARQSSAYFVAEGPILRDEFGDTLREDRRPWYRSNLLAVGMLVLSWCVQIARYFDNDGFSLESAVLWGSVYVVFIFAISWFAAYPVWVKVLHRRSGGMAALASLVCLCWSLAEFLFRVHLW